MAYNKAVEYMENFDERESQILKAHLLVPPNKGKEYRFFYHYHHQTRSMTIHFKGKCLTAKNISCEVPCESKWNKTQPNLVMQGWCHEVSIDGNDAVIK